LRINQTIRQRFAKIYEKLNVFFLLYFRFQKMPWQYLVMFHLLWIGVNCKSFLIETKDAPGLIKPTLDGSHALQLAPKLFIPAGELPANPILPPSPPAVAADEDCEAADPVEHILASAAAKMVSGARLRMSAGRKAFQNHDYRIKIH
jgi:hypothetical protein